MANLPGGAVNALVLGQKELYTSGRFSDLTIDCNGRLFKVHRYCLYTQSPVFQRLLGGEFKEAQSSQSVMKVDDDPEIFQAFLFFLYNFHIESATPESSTSPFAVRLYAIADKYNLPTLQSVAATRLDKLSDPTRDLSDFLSGLAAIDAHTAPHDPTLWDVVIPKIKKHIGLLLAAPAFRDLVQDLPELNLMLLAQLDPTGAAAGEVGGSGGGGRGKGRDYVSGGAGAARSGRRGGEVVMRDGGDDEDDEDDDIGTIAFDRHVGGRGGNRAYRGPGRRLGDA